MLIEGKSAISEKIGLKSLKLFYRSFVKSHKKVINRALINVTPLLKVKQLKQKTINCKDITFKILGFSLATINIFVSLILSIITLNLFLNYEKN